MKIIYQDLLRLLSDKPSKDLLSSKLFQLGHEHEIHGDIFDMEFTPNRGDCLSIYGLARDLKFFFGSSESIEIYTDKVENFKVNFENLSPKDCPKISFLELEIEGDVASYEPYLENYFTHLGNNKVNFFTDISNYVSYELGQPTHCYDMKNINNKIIFENIDQEVKFSTLLNKEINLSGINSVFTMKNKVISLAGVIGGASSACSDNTKKVLIECAFFNPESIIGKSIKYNLKSDAAHKFERGVDISSHEKVLRRFINIVQDHANIKNIRFDLSDIQEPIHKSLSFDVNIINNILGIHITKDKYKSYLENLGFRVAKEIQIPAYRHDIKTQNDLAEEIARVIGYDEIKSEPIKLQQNINNKQGSISSKITSYLVDNGFCEVINSSFTSIRDNKTIHIDNPLDSNRGFFRTSLKNSLIDNLIYNERRQKESIKIFEISDIYSLHDNEIRKEERIGIIISGRRGYNHIDFSKKLDSKYFNKLFKDINININNLIESIPRDSIDTKRKSDIYYIEINISELNNSDIPFMKLTTSHEPINFIRYENISEYPSSFRDLSFSITNLSNVSNLIETLKRIKHKNIKNSFMFDFYKNEAKQSVKIGYRFVFQSRTHTLNEREINLKIDEISELAFSIEGVSIPGM